MHRMCVIGLPCNINLNTQSNVRIGSTQHIRPICPTRWLVRVSAIQAVLNKYELCAESAPPQCLLRVSTHAWCHYTLDSCMRSDAYLFTNPAARHYGKRRVFRLYCTTSYHSSSISILELRYMHFSCVGRHLGCSTSGSFHFGYTVLIFVP